MEDKHSSTGTIERLFEEIVRVSITVQESTARIDERVKFLIEHQVEVERNIREIVSDQRDMTKRILTLEAKNLDKIIEEINRLHEVDRIKLDKLNNLETKIAHIESVNAGLMARAMGVVDVATKALVGALIAFLLYKLGLDKSILGK